MWDIQITNSLSILKNKKLNILQIGFSNNENSVWLINNIMKNKKSKLYILNLWYQHEKNKEMMNDQSMLKYFDFKNGDKIFFEDLKEYSEKIINVKKKSEEMFSFFRENKILFDLILIDYQFL